METVPTGPDVSTEGLAMPMNTQYGKETSLREHDKVKSQGDWHEEESEPHVIGQDLMYSTGALSTRAIFPEVKI